MKPLIEVDAQVGDEARRIRRPPLRVLLVAPLPPPMHGIARYGQDMLDRQLATWHRITPLNDAIPFAWRPRGATQDHTWNIVGRDGLLPTVRVLWFVAGRMSALDRTLRRGAFDVMHVLSTAGLGFFRNGVHLWLARRRGVKTVFHLLGQIDDLIRDAGPRLQRVISYCLDLADVNVVQSPGLAAFVRQYTGRPVRAIFNGVDVDRLAPPSGYARSTEGRVRVISLGVLGHKKGTFDLLEAAAKMKDRLATLDFLFVGAGEVERFRKLAAEKALSGRVTFTGSVDDATRITLLHTSDIFALPSRAEGQPIALLEAMAAGLPVIASSVGSLPEVVGERNGHLITPGDVDALVRHLETLATDARLREQMGRFNAEQAKQKYRLDRVMQEIDDVWGGL
ncbi:MAG: glycosyltransferase family 4 protein [Gemmatimonadetes bacterium]|nr:glycosyltransferase family 4 protein [Gemmatimonadota bacterium]